MGDQERVLALIRQHPGMTQAVLEWLSAGGKVGAAGPEGEVTVTWAEFMKARDTTKRVSDLVKRHKVVRGTARIRIRTSATGYYPAGPVQAAPPATRRPERADNERPQARASGAAGLAGLKRLLGE